MTLTAVWTPDSEGGYAVHHPEKGTSTQGESVAESLAKLREAMELFLEEFPFEATGPKMLGINGEETRTTVVL
jgi:predicted RNase H-like HicB family nuclease